LKGSEKEVGDIIEKIESNLARNQNPTHKFSSSENTVGGKSGQAFGFLSSGQREEVQKLLFKIKSTGKKVEDPNFRVILEDAEVQDQAMTNLFSLDDQIHQAFEQELKKDLTAFVKTTSPLYNKMKIQLIEQVMASVRKSYKCFSEDSIKRLQTNLAFGSKDLPEDEFERVIVSSAGAELSSKANQAFHQTVTIASDYLYEKMHDQLKDIVDELSSEVANDIVRRGSEAPVTSKVGASKPPQKAPPKTPVKSPEPAKTKSAPKKVETPVDSLPTVESNLEHATKDRPTQGNKRPPTRKKRPAPPTSAVAM